jgi:pimeloyl-ACP methyl ester carboxylesterase/ribosomal protein S18 acetylase RimI-like enzyme
MKPLSQRPPNVSPAIFSRLKSLLRVLQAVSPRLAGRLAFKLFLKPARRELHATDAAFMASAKQRQLQVGDDRVQVYEWGTGARTVLVVHGWGSRAARFAPLASALASRGWRVLAFDAPGHGLSPGASSSLPQFMAALDAIAMQLGPVQAVIGHSLGALAIACQRASAPPWAGSLQKVVLVSMPAGAAFLVDSFQQMFGIGAATARQLLARFRQRFDTTPEFFSASPDAAPLQHATLLVHDRHDDIVPFAHSEQLLPRLKAGTLLATESLGHSALTRDAATNQAIGAFLDAGTGAATAPVRRADLHDDADAAAIVRLLDAYATDPRGGGAALPAAVQARLVEGLRATPTARVWLAFEGTEATGVCVGFVGYSTFQARPLLNIHDLAVLPGRRGRGTGGALLAAAEAQALAEGCCKLTLEVQDDNTPARQLYDRFGFRDVRYGDSGPTRFLGKTL